MTRAARDSDLPPVDERLVAPESRFEIWDGKVEYVAPADEPHGRQHSKISALLEAHVKEGYTAASDMLTRTSAIDDIAPDASVYRAERDPSTGARQLEELAFEVASTESLGHAGRKAHKLAGRGVRRVFAVDVVRQRVVEWATETRSWRILDQESAIVDDALAAPLPVKALVSAAAADDAMALALLAKHNAVLVSALDARLAQGRQEGEAQGRQEGESQGKLGALIAILNARGIPLTAEQEAQLRAPRDAATLDGWLRAAVVCSSVGELLPKG